MNKTPRSNLIKKHLYTNLWLIFCQVVRNLFYKLETCVWRSVTYFVTQKWRRHLDISWIKEQQQRNDMVFTLFLDGTL